MLDTIKLGIPLSSAQHGQIKTLAEKNECWQWILHNPVTGELLFRRTKGIATTDGESFHRQLRWDMPNEYSDDCKLILEFSVPKYWYGHNIRLLYDFAEPLRCLKVALENQFGLRGKKRLPDIMTWLTLRVDVCYTWQFPSQRIAQSYLDSLKRLHYPRKKPTYYPTGILFAGNTFSVKFYLKAPEFRNHDRKEMLKSGASLEWINHCEEIADGVLRFEATLRGKFLSRHKIRTVADILRPVEYIEWLGEPPPSDDMIRAIVASHVLCSHLFKQLPSDPSSAIDTLLPQILGQKPLAIMLKDGLDIPYEEFVLKDCPFSPLLRELPDELQNVTIKAGCLGWRKGEKLALLGQSLLSKFVSGNSGMQQVDEIETKLMQTFKPVKAARLVSFWLYVQRFGSTKTKDVFGDRSYYYTKSELRKAGISLIEPPSGNAITVIDRKFMRDFELKIPSPFVTNKVDDFRDSCNVLNYVPKMSGYDEQA